MNVKQLNQLTMYLNRGCVHQHSDICANRLSTFYVTHEYGNDDGLYCTHAKPVARVHFGPISSDYLQQHSTTKEDRLFVWENV